MEQTVKQMKKEIKSTNDLERAISTNEKKQARANALFGDLIKKRESKKEKFKKSKLLKWEQILADLEVKFSK
jgi:hypothetical protein